MKRLLQLVSGVLLMLALALAWRIVQVVQIKPPVFSETVQVAAVDPPPPAPRRPTPPGAAIEGIVGGNLFETERGQKAKSGDPVVGEAPLPPPTNVVLNGVFVREGEPIAIVTDTSSGSTQKALRAGENIGDYRVGEISSDRVTLLGRGGQRFLLELDIKKGAAPGVRQGASPRPGTRTGAPRPAVRTPAQTRAAAQARAAASARARGGAAPAPAATAASRAAALRARAAQNRTPPRSPDPSQVRLQALKQLRGAATGR